MRMVPMAAERARRAPKPAKRLDDPEGVQRGRGAPESQRRPPGVHTLCSDCVVHASYVAGSHMGNAFVTVTLDWDAMENAEAFAEGITEIQTFHERFPLAPITHFICPIYFGLDVASSANRKLASALFFAKHELARNAPLEHADDELALHIHCWYSLMHACEIMPVLSEPSYHTEATAPVMNRKGGFTDDSGHGVLFGAYPRFQIRQILRKAKAFLAGAFDHAPNIVGFRCGGWMASDEVIAAVSEEGFLYDASALDAGHVAGAGMFEDYPLLRKYLIAIWGTGDAVRDGPCKNADIIRKAYPGGLAIYKKGVFTEEGMLEAQPREIYRDLVEVPDTGILADYITEKDMLRHLQLAAALAKNRDVYTSIGFHFQGTNNFRKLVRVVAAIYGQEPFRFVTVAEAARRFVKKMFRLKIVAPKIPMKIDTTLRDLDGEFRASLNRSPQEIAVLGKQGPVAAIHWAWESGLVIRIECAQDLVALHAVSALVVIFSKPKFELEVAAVEAG
jgi:hypothetical protein